MSKTVNTKKTPTRRRKQTSLGQLLDRLVDKPLRQRGFAQTDIISHWREIVGEDLANAVVPVALRMPRGERMGGTLEVRTESAFAPILQHREQHLFERINSYYGFAAVARLVIRQGPVPRQQARRQGVRKPLDDAQRQHLDELLAGAGDSDLGRALDRLGQEIYARDDSESRK